MRFSFQKQLILIMVMISAIPLLILGLNSLKLADRSLKPVYELQNHLMNVITNEIGNYFENINLALVFTRIFEKRRNLSILEINKVLLNFLQSRGDVTRIAYLREGKSVAFMGEQLENYEFFKRIESLFQRQTKELQISDSYKVDKKHFFDIIYPLKNRDLIFITFSLKNLMQKLESHRIGKTGVFIILRDNNVFLGDEVSGERLSKLKIKDLLREREGLIMEEKNGYLIRIKKIESLIMPFWLVFNQKTSEIKKLTEELKKRIVFWMILVVTVASLTGFSLAKRISKPIVTLIDASKKVSKGDLDIKAEKGKAKGEMATLIETFNKMLFNLKEFQGKLVESECLAAVGQMANIVGHDLRNPLWAIENAVYYLKMKVDTRDKKVNDTLQAINRELKHSNKIINDLLGFSRQRQPVLRPVKLDSLIEETLSVISVPDEIKIVKKLQENLPIIKIDPDEIRQVLVNLVNNAIQACNKKGEVLIETKLFEPLVEISISDNGAGISEENIKKLFTPFFSTKSRGTGLGLVAAKRIIERHKGKINISSKIGAGTKVIIKLPIRG